jgi:hypothetical protein
MQPSGRRSSIGAAMTMVAEDRAVDGGEDAGVVEVPAPRAAGVHEMPWLPE